MMGGGRARVTRDGCPSSRAAQFSKTTRRGRRVSSPPPSARVTKKAPRWRGPERCGRDRGRSGLLLRGGSLRDPKQERPGSIARDRPHVQEPAAPVEADEAPLPDLQHAARRAPRPAGPVARPSSASPSSFTPPWRAAGAPRCVLTSRRRRRSARAGAPPPFPGRHRLRARDELRNVLRAPRAPRGRVSKWASAASAAAAPWNRSTIRRASSRFASAGCPPGYLLARGAARSRCPSPRRERSSASRTSPPAAPSPRRSCRATCSSAALPSVPGRIGMVMIDCSGTS